MNRRCQVVWHNSLRRLFGVEELQYGSSARIVVFDHFRGLLLCWMILGHAYHLMGEPKNFPLHKLRPGAATDSFVMLTGFVIAWIYMPRSFTWVQSRQLLRRAVFVFVVAYLSNLAFAFARDVTEGQASFDNLIRMASFQRTWTISVILVATSLTLACSTALLPIVKCLGGGWALVCMTLALIGFHGCRAWSLPPTEWIDAVMDRTIFERSLIDLMLMSMWAFSLSAWLREHRPTASLWTALLAGAVCCFLVCRWQWPPRAVTAIGRAPSQFIVSLWIAALVGNYLPRVAKVVGVLGRQSLVVFLLHRVVLQLTLVLAGGYLTGATGTWVLVGTTVVVCWVVAYSIGPLRSPVAYKHLLQRFTFGAFKLPA